MNKRKHLQFIAILLLAFALSLTIVPVCQAQLEGDAGSDEVVSGETDSESGGSGSDTVGGGSGETDTGSGGEQSGSPSARPGWEV